MGWVMVGLRFVRFKNRMLEEKNLLLQTPHLPTQTKILIFKKNWYLFTNIPNWFFGVGI